MFTLIRVYEFCLYNAASRPVANTLPHNPNSLQNFNTVKLKNTINTLRHAKPSFPCVCFYLRKSHVLKFSMELFQRNPDSLIYQPKVRFHSIRQQSADDADGCSFNNLTSYLPTCVSLSTFRNNSLLHLFPKPSKVELHAQPTGFTSTK